MTVTELRQEYDWLVYERNRIQRRIEYVRELLEEQGEQP